jgi:hypothetical protein
MTEKKHSTRFSHEQLVGTKCRVIRGFFASQPGSDVGVLVGYAESRAHSHADRC